MKNRVEIAEASAVPFSRENLSILLGVGKAKINNWLSRNELWQSHRGLKFHRSYTIRELFDLGGFAAMRDAGIPERQCAQFVRNFGFYRKFLSRDGRADFSRKDGEWQIGVFDPNATVSLSINMRRIGVDLMRQLASRIASEPDAFPRDAFENFSALYCAYVTQDFLPPNSVAAFEVEE